MLKLNKKQQRFVNVYSKYGGNYALVCQELKIGMRQFDKYMSQVEVKEYLNCAMERVRNSMVDALPHIQQELLRMYNSNETDDKIKLEIAKQFMDRAGLFADKNVNVNVNINTQLSMRARQILVEKQHSETIETTAKPVTEPICDNLQQFSTIEIPQPTTTTIETI